MEKLKVIYDAVREILPEGELFLVGGAVRDAEMKLIPKDFDFTGSLDPDTVEDLVKKAGRRAYTTGKRFGTIGFKAPYQDGETTKYEYIEYTTYRTEYYDGKSRKPEVVFAKTLKEDLSRRDFTFNAMAFDGEKILDFYGGRLDIHAKKIKTVGMPKDRIQEDPLRMLRAARFAARYNFEIDPNFIGKARQLADRIYDVSIERWVQELDKLLMSDHYKTGMDQLDKMALLERILPEQYDYPEGPFENADIAWKAQLANVDENTKTARYMATGICSRLKFSNERTNIILDKPKKKV